MMDNNTPFDMVILEPQNGRKIALVIIRQINAEKIPETFASEVFPNDVKEQIARESRVGRKNIKG